MKSNGFTLLEVLFAFSILTFTILTTVPVLTKVQLENEALKEERVALSVLHDQWIAYIYGDYKVAEEEIHAPFPINITFDHENELVKACATWENRKSEQENYCIYGYEYS
ncbi:prepilin-type N-terminal cleavage/methylation domain-containing protein [Thalassobacillus hwangdonensis]|uniref:Prepilin-type N-terminal cleavage/methylation domain-containing protein n=1 Tax=Thalassobacillus hwangdonensis TaxID=546108 RepID=A0ABW3KXW3_9BACI